MTETRRTRNTRRARNMTSIGRSREAGSEVHTQTAYNTKTAQDGFCRWGRG